MTCHKPRLPLYTFLSPFLIVFLVCTNNALSEEQSPQKPVPTDKSDAVNTKGAQKSTTEDQSKDGTTHGEKPSSSGASYDEKWQRPDPKPLSENVNRGLQYLISQQDESGGWGQGGGWRTKQGGGRVEGADVNDPPDVGNTCIAALALIRAGNTPNSGPYAKELAKAVNFIEGRLEAADDDSLYVTDVRNTQLAAASSPGGKPVDSAGVERSVKSSLSRSSDISSFRSSPAAGDAGVQLYSLSANANRVNHFGITGNKEMKKLKKVAQDESLPQSERDAAKEQVEEYEAGQVAQQKAATAVMSRLGDQKFVKGFGNNGGEEFLSYMNISEAMFMKGGRAWDEGDKTCTKTINGCQNNDGSWSGHHCITGRTFCTSAALLTLLADRLPVPEDEQNEVANKDPNEATDEATDEAASEATDEK